MYLYSCLFMYLFILYACMLLLFVIERRHAEMIEQHTGEWVCRSCTTRNDSSSNSCSVCHTDKPNSGGRRNPSPGPRRTPAGSTHWACDSCTFRNPASNSTCEICGGAK